MHFIADSLMLTISLPALFAMNVGGEILPDDSSSVTQHHLNTIFIFLSCT